MKRPLTRAICLIVVVALMAGFCVAYAATSEEAGTRYAYHGFYLALERGGKTDTDSSQVKDAPFSYAIFSLTTITNTTGYPLYINVRDASGVYIRGNAATINYGQSTPVIKSVYYISGHGITGVSYCPSGQTSSNAVYGGYIQGSWMP